MPCENENSDSGTDNITLFNLSEGKDGGDVKRSRSKQTDRLCNSATTHPVFGREQASRLINATRKKQKNTFLLRKNWSDSITFHQVFYKSCSMTLTSQSFCISLPSMAATGRQRTPVPQFMQWQTRSHRTNYPRCATIWHIDRAACRYDA